MSYNKISIIGRLGKDPQLRHTPQGTVVCNFSVATNANKDKEDTIWFKVTVWGRLGEAAAQYLSKGREVYVEGPLTVSEWADQNGVTRTSLEVTARELQFLGGSSSQTDKAVRSNVAADTNTRNEDGLPF